MVTFSQHHNNTKLREKKKHTNRVLSLKGNPYKRGFILKIYEEKPKKPNSAKRRIVQIYLFYGKKIRAQVPGEGQWGLSKFNKVLVRGGHTRDLPGVRYRVVRGNLDAKPVLSRRNARSKYGVNKVSWEEYQRIMSTAVFKKKKKKK